MKPLHTAIFCTLATVPLLTGCLTKQPVAHVPDAENLLYTEDGRLFVSGGPGVYEIKPGSGNDYYQNGYHAEALWQNPNPLAECYFAGLAQWNGWLFADCQEIGIKTTDNPASVTLVYDAHLVAAKLEPGVKPEFIVLDDPAGISLDQIRIPNGIAFTPTGDLLIADWSPGGSGVAKVSVDFSTGIPRLTGFMPNFVGPQHGVVTPNGLRVADNSLFVSNRNKVTRLEFAPDGSVPVQVTAPTGLSVDNAITVWQGASATIVDDILPYCGGVAITDFSGGRLVYARPNGVDTNGRPQYQQKYRIWAFTFTGPSALAVGQGPLFSDRDLLVTEKGVPMVLTAGAANRLTRVPTTLDLSDPLTCEVINEE